MHGDKLLNDSSAAGKASFDLFAPLGSG